MATAPANGFQSPFPSVFHTKSPESSVATGSGERKMMFGKLNHFALTVSLASGVTIDTSATPSATHISPQRAQRIALARRAPAGVAPRQVGAEQDVAAADGAADHDREQPVAEAAREAGDVAPEHQALRERGDEGARPEQPVPQLAVPALGLDAQLEGDPAQHEADEHHGDRHVERPEHDAVRHRER